MTDQDQASPSARGDHPASRRVTLTTDERHSLPLCEGCERPIPGLIVYLRDGTSWHDDCLPVKGAER